MAYEARAVPPPPIRRGQGVGNVGSEFPVKGKGKGKAKVERSKAGPTKSLEGEATSKPPASSSAKPSSMKVAVARAEKKKRKAGAVRALCGHLTISMMNMELCMHVLALSWALPTLQ